jgi:small-conductance mechanosensitive channel
MRTMKPLWLACGLAALLVGARPTAAQPPAKPSAEDAAVEVPTAPVVLDGQTLFEVRGYAGLSAAERARAIADRIAAFARTDAPPDSLAVAESDHYAQIMAGSIRIMGVLDADAGLEGLGRAVLAQAYLMQIRKAVQRYRQDRSRDVLVSSAGWALAGTVAFAAVFVAAYWTYRRVRAFVERRYRARVHDVQIKSFQLVRAERIWHGVMALVKLAWLIVAIVATYVYLNFVLVLFPWTRGLGLGLTSMVVVPLRVIGGGALALVPNAVFLAILAVVTRYLLKLLKLFFDGIAGGHVKLERFDPDWALPTYRLIRILVIAFALIVAYPYIPGSQSDAFKGVSLFVGLVFSLGSSAFIGNVIAGYSMTYRRAFRVGDRVKIGEHVGAVEQIRLMVTHLRTPKNEEVIVPNSAILNQEVLNYSAMARKEGLILHTTVGIGYETPWRQVEAMLLEAARRTPGLLSEPPPFVLQRGLEDFCVTYEINVYCGTPDRMLQLYSALHQNILDLFNEYGVQIMTPAYEGDPPQPKVVQKSDWYLAPARPPSAAGG